MKVLLIDDHEVFRIGLEHVIQPLVAPDPVVPATSCEEAFAALDRLGPMDIAMVDIHLPGMSGVEGISVMRQRWPAMPVIALSSADDRDTVLAALDAGAMGFVPKSANSQVLIAAVRLILAGGIYLPPSVFLSNVASAEVPAASSHAVPAPELPPARRPEELGLTPRQCDVLHQILQGRSAKEIARKLDLAPSTVKAHTGAVLRALNVTTRTQAVVAAGRMGLRFGAPDA
jgi:DNA-binding NarL/FixJ family response regulator